MNEHIDELRDLLSHHTLGHPYDWNSIHHERFMIDHLTEMVRDMEIGDVDIQDVRREFSKHNLGNFSFDLWFTEMVNEGVYSDPLELEET